MLGRKILEATKNNDYDLMNILHKRKLVGIFRIMKGYEFKYIVATIAISLSSMARTARYFLLQYFVDDYLTLGTAQYGLFLIAASIVLLTLLTSGASYLSGRYTAEVSEGSTKRLRDFLFDHMQHLPYAYHNESNTGELIQKATSDVDTLRRFFAANAIGIARTLTFFTVNFVGILLMSVKLALLSIIIIPFIVLISAFFFKRISKAYEKYQEKDAALSTTLQENLSGVRVVKAFAKQDHEILKFGKNNSEKYEAGLRLNWMHSLFWPISDIFCGLQIIVGYSIGGMMALNGEITVGTYLAYAGMLIWLIFPMRNLGRLIVEMSRGFVSYDRVCSIIKEQREPLDQGDYQPEHINGDVTFNGVGFSYEDGHPILEDISFGVKAGQSIALLGSTGSGKTTLVNLLPRFFEYTKGSIELDDVELNRYPRRFLRQHIGTVEQEPFLFSRSLRDNILFGVNEEVSEEAMFEAAKAAAIHDVILTFPNGYATMVGEKGVTLSGGQKQRVAIARTLLKNPKILIMDDSTSSVDTETESQIRSALNRMMENRTTFIIAHRIQSIMNADLILVLDDGKVVQSGTHDELLKLDGIYRNIFSIQTMIEEELQKEISSVS
ncbi:MAG: ABC transporter ATP-binding protein/permease [Anaerolineaceae bacterium]|nr:ABC transporter ATP-binding protein/permease [Anaerolineaceae bacterium]